MNEPRYIMIGGFLGAGKSTAVLRLAEYYTTKGLRVGLITNDQSVGLVDTAVLSSHGHAVEEISGGCFCCRFDSLVQASERLRERSRPDVLIAEPVGSCTDLVATVSYPLRRLYGESFTIAPLSVMIDPIRALTVLGLAEGAKFSAKVDYVYLKQLEEAHYIVINKCDLINDSDRQKLEDTIRERYPGRKCFIVSAQNHIGLESWFDDIASNELTADTAMQIDYDTYADGEALLGWLNATIELVANQPFDIEPVMINMAQDIQNHLKTHDVEIAHLKMTVTPANIEASRLSVLNLVRSDDQPKFVAGHSGDLREGKLLLNVRAESDPKLLHEAMNQAMLQLQERSQVTATLDHLQAFRPARPQPTHRLAELNA